MSFKEQCRQCFKEQCRQYLSERRSTYEFRCNRYQAVAQKMLELGWDKEYGTLVDIGAGTRDFHAYLLQNKDVFGAIDYTPIDGSIDGTDLNFWIPQQYYHFYVAIEILEHLRDPMRLVAFMEHYATKGVIVTTPNSAVVSTLEIDPTHQTALFAESFEERGWQTEIVSLFCKPEDTILAWYSKNAKPQNNVGSKL